MQNRISPPNLPMLRTPLRVGEQAEYQMCYQTQVHTAGLVVGLPARFAVTIDMGLRIIHPPSTKGLLLDISVRDVTFDGLEPMAKQLRTAIQSLDRSSIFIIYSSSLLPKQIACLPKVAPLAREIVRQLACWLQYAIQHRPSWKLVEYWIDREVWAEYTVLRRSPQSWYLSKVWQTLPPKNPELMPARSQLDAEFRVAYHPPTQSLSRVEGSLRLQAPQQESVYTQYQVSIKQTDLPKRIDAKTLHQVKRLMQQLQTNSVKNPVMQILSYDEFNAQLYQQAIKDFDIEKVKQSLIKANQTQSPLNDNSLFLQLRSYFALSPKKISEFLDWFFSISPNDYLIVFIITCLLSASEYTPALVQAQEAVVALLKRFQTRQEVILQFLNGLPSVKRVSRELADYMWQEAQKVPSDSASIVHANWVLATGGLVRLIPNEPLTKRILAWLEMRLKSASEPLIQGLYLGALGNTGQASIWPIVKPYLSHRDSWLRRQAVSALRYLRDTEAQTALWRAGTTDSDPAVRREAYMALSFQSEPVPLVHLVEAFCAEKEPTVQEALWELFKKHALEQSSGRYALQQIIPCVRAQTLRQQILSFLSPP
ncbi:MAG: hypothetical protein C4336_00270 [Armatimonadota bacterium]